MPLKQLLSFSLLFIALSAGGQINIQTPRICHDNEGYLTSYFDSSYLMQFNKGNFQSLNSADSNFVYTDSNKTITFYPLFFPPIKEPVKVQLLPHSILITTGSKQMELDSLPDSPLSFHDFHIGIYTKDNFGRGLVFETAGERSVEVEVWTWEKTWTWNIVVRKKEQSLLINYNGFRKNRIERLMLMDDSLKLGMSVWTTFKSSKKLWRLGSFYDAPTKNIRAVMPTYNPYWYWYRKNGKLNKKKSCSAINICN